MPDEEKKNPEQGGRQPGMLDNLFDIVNDLWGETQRDAAAGVSPAAKAAAAPTQAADQPAAAPVSTELPFETFWKRADESVDWTDALAHTAPSDGLSSPEDWAFFHEKAERVLSGDLQAYAEVLRRIQPLADLKPYTSGCKIAIRSADRVAVTFTPDEGRMAGSDADRYLAGISLRCARDVLALLPVKEVTVSSQLNGGTLLEVTYTRDALRDVIFAYVDPASLVTELGGHFGHVEA